MFNDNRDTSKNIKDTSKDSLKDTSSVPAPYSNSVKDRRPFYGKTDKLITALYMVTDIMDKDEPIRHKLRALGIEILSDMHSTSGGMSEKITQTISFLNVASAMSFISEMNCSILKKEFLELSKVVNENKEVKPAWLDEFFSTPTDQTSQGSLDGLSFRSVSKDIADGFKGHPSASRLRGQEAGTRIGVQKGSTLLQALSDKTRFLHSNNYASNAANLMGAKDRFGVIKNERRNEILDIIKSNNGSATIKDIKAKISSVSGGLSYSEKTLQRELTSMVKNGVLNKTGEKRWSKYFLKS